MRNVQFRSVIWTILLAAPFTILAIFATAYLSLHLFDIVAQIVQILNQTTYIGQPLMVEILERMPELIGMGAGMAVLMALLLLFKPAENNSK